MPRSGKAKTDVKPSELSELSPDDHADFVREMEHAMVTLNDSLADVISKANGDQFANHLELFQRAVIHFNPKHASRIAKKCETICNLLRS